MPNTYKRASLAWIIWLSAGLFYLYEFIHRVIISVMIPELMESFHVSVAGLGGVSASYFYAYAIAQIPVGILIDRYGTRWTLTLACMLLAAASWAFAITNNLGVAELARLLIGFASAFAFVGCLKLGAIWLPNHKFAFIVGLTNLLGVSGAIIGGKPMANAVDLYGWRAIMLASAAVGALNSAILAMLLRKETAGSKQQHTGEYSELWSKIRTVLKCRQTWLVAAFGGFMVAPIATYSELWGVSFLVDTYHLHRPDAAQITTLTFIGIAIGGPVIGWISDHIMLRKLPMQLGLVGALASISAILFIPALPLWMLYVFHISFGFFTSSMLLCFSISTEYATPKIRATSIALINSIIMAMGAVLQTVSGLILEFSNASFDLSFSPLILCYLMALLCLRFIRETRCSDSRNG